MYEVTSDKAVRELQARLDAALELAGVCVSPRAKLSDYMRAKLQELLDALVAVNDQWNATVQQRPGEE